MDELLDYSVGVRIKGGVAEAIRRKSHEEYRSFNATLNLLLMQAIKKPVIENLVEEVQRLSSQVDLLTATIDSLAKQLGGKKK